MSKLSSASKKASIGQSPEVLPHDEYNATLVANVHPPDWENPEPAPRYNLVVIGAGTAGLVTAAGAAGLGAKVALIERYLLGGDCLNVGCVPSKCVIRSSRVLGDLAAATELGVHIPAGTAVNFPAVMERMRRLRARISHHDSAHRFHEQLVDRAIADGEEGGFVKVHVKKGTEQILDATIVARHAGEMINEITLALVSKIGLGTLSSVIHPYPTQAEAIRKAADAYNRTRLTPFVKKLFNSWLAWTR